MKVSSLGLHCCQNNLLVARSYQKKSQQLELNPYFSVLRRRCKPLNHLVTPKWKEKELDLFYSRNQLSLSPMDPIPISNWFFASHANSDQMNQLCRFSSRAILWKKWGWDLFRLIWLHDRRKSEPKDRLTFEQVAAVLCWKTDTKLLCTRARFNKNITRLNLIKSVI